MTDPYVKARDQHGARLSDGLWIVEGGIGTPVHTTHHEIDPERLAQYLAEWGDFHDDLERVMDDD